MLSRPVGDSFGDNGEAVQIVNRQEREDQGLADVASTAPDSPMDRSIVR
jgi:hypothetical protein